MAETADLFDVIATNRSIRHFRPDPVPEAHLQRIVEAAIRAPSGSNRQNWRFLVLRDAAVRAQVGALYRESYYESLPERLQSPAANTKLRVLQTALYLADHMGVEPPLLILACLENTGNQPAGRTAGASIYPAVQNLMLTARALGLGTCLTTLHLRREAQIKELLGIPGNVDTYALIPLGYPAAGFGPLSRRPVAEVVYRDRWGETLA